MEINEDKMKSLKELKNQLNELDNQFYKLKAYDKIVEMVPDGTVIYREDDSMDPEDYDDYEEGAIPMGEMGAIFDQPKWPRYDWIEVTKALIKDGCIIAIEVWDCYESEAEETYIYVNRGIENLRFFENLLTSIKAGWMIPEDKLDTLKFWHC